MANALGEKILSMANQGTSGNFTSPIGINAIREITGQKIFLVTTPQFVWNKKDKCVVDYFSDPKPHLEQCFTVIQLLKDEELPKFLKENKDNYLIFYINQETGSIFHSSDTYICPHCGTVQPSKIPRHVRVYIDVNERKTKLNKLNKLKNELET